MNSPHNCNIDYLLRMRKSIENEINMYYDMEPLIKGIDDVTINEIIDKLQNHLQNINKKIMETCCHNYVDDYIDVDVEQSMPITYCTICEHTK